MKNRKEETKEKFNLKFIDVIHIIEVIHWIYELAEVWAQEIEYLQGLF